MEEKCGGEKAKGTNGQGREWQDVGEWGRKEGGREGGKEISKTVDYLKRSKG